MGSSPTPGTKTVETEACLRSITVLYRGGTRKRAPRVPVSRRGGASRAEKLFGATATKKCSWPTPTPSETFPNQNISVQSSYPPILRLGGAFEGNESVLSFHFSLPPIAQLVEQSPLKRTVVGSNPTGRTRFDSAARIASFSLKRKDVLTVPKDFPAK